MKEAQVYRGIEFIRICDLPEQQRSLIMEWAAQDERIIKILKEDELMDDCIQYKHYKQWVVEVFEPALAKANSKNASEKSVNSVKLAVGGR